MATSTQSFIEKKLTAPALLWIGSHAHLVPYTIDFLQKIYCQYNDCKICTTCSQINQQEHHAIIWIKPEKEFVLQDLAIITQTITFKLENYQQFFFVIQHADYMKKACANSLLKTLEEPPAGYHFILLAEQQQAILPTIASRCQINSFYQKESSLKYHQLFQFFTTTTFQDPTVFLQELDKAGINELESKELIDRIFVYWLQKCTQAQIAQNQDEYLQTQKIISLVKHLAQLPLMPGSSKFFWKNLFMQIKHSSLPGIE